MSIFRRFCWIALIGAVAVPAAAPAQQAVSNPWQDFVSNAPSSHGKSDDAARSRVDALDTTRIGDRIGARVSPSGRNSVARSPAVTPVIGPGPIKPSTGTPR